MFAFDFLRVVIRLLFLTGISTSATKGGLFLLWQRKDFQIPDSKGRQTLSSIHHSHHRLFLHSLATRKVFWSWSTWCLWINMESFYFFLVLFLQWSVTWREVENGLMTVWRSVTSEPPSISDLLSYWRSSTITHAEPALHIWTSGRCVFVLFSFFCVV